MNLLNTGVKFCVASLALGASTVNAALILSETFSYADGNLVGNSTWAAHSGAGNTPIQVASGAITLLQGAGSREAVNIKPIGLLPLAAGGKVYASFDVAVSGSSSNVYFAHFISGISVFDARVFVAPFLNSDYTIGLGTGSSPTSTWETGLTFGTTYKIVVSYDFETGATNLWVNPASEISPMISVNGTTLRAIEGFAFRQARQANPAIVNTQIIDNLMLGTTFGSAIPEPSSYAAIFGGLALAGVMARRRRA